MLFDREAMAASAASSIRRFESASESHDLTDTDVEPLQQHHNHRDSEATSHLSLPHFALGRQVNLNKHNNNLLKTRTRVD